MYAAEVDGQRLTFQVAGVYRRNMIMRDLQTGTLWQHATGEALMGPLKGVQLNPLGGELIRWSQWVNMVPHTTLAIEPDPELGRYPGLIPRKRLEFLLHSFTTRHAATGFISDRRLALHDEIVGVSLDGVDKAYPLSLLRKHVILHDQIGQTKIALLYNVDADHVTAFDCQVEGKEFELIPTHSAISSRDGTMRWSWKGEPLTAHTAPLQRLQVERQWWLGWVEFHPTSEVFQLD